MNFGKFFKSSRATWIACVIFLVYTLGSFAFYFERTLDGNINNHILAAEQFGVPTVPAEHGIRPFYRGPAQSGWDGQFYYYMSNDILGRKDIPQHIDSPSYRYQRIGLSLYAAIVAKLLGHDWVSPTLYFFSYFFLLFVSVWAGARLFARNGIAPALILLWALGIGVQVTLFSALPDAAADAFLILALLGLTAQRYFLSAVAFAFAALSREVYTLFPSVLFLFYLGEAALAGRKEGRSWGGVLAQLLAEKKRYLFLLVPGVVAVAWRVYIQVHFGVAPSAQAQGTLGLPLASWYQYFVSGVAGNHLSVGSGRPAYDEAVALALFLLVLICTVWVSVRVLAARGRDIPILVRAVACTAIVMAALYACFGPIVIMYYTGYFKAAGLFFLLLPLLLHFAPVSRGGRTASLVLLFVALAFTTYYNMRARVLPANVNVDRYVQISAVTESAPLECLGRYDAAIHVNGIALHTKSAFARMLGATEYMLVDVTLTNSGDKPLLSTKGSGSVYLSYQWVNADGNVVVDGIRTAILKPIAPGESRAMSVWVELPARQRGQLQLKLSPIQEGCAWFYRSNPKTAADIRLSGEY